uniref:Bifunctional methylenetetrahydrofolate dehydrogenase/cyclohydrolase, mitochondrial-like n=1 Tax=Sinocyclocheilus grahami TaxID=75366 RepID=A0A672QAG0_SINGR
EYSDILQSVLLSSVIVHMSSFRLSSWFLFSRQEAVIISGRKLSRQIRNEARDDLEEWVAAGNRRPHLSVVLVGDNPASHSYVLNKTRAAAEVDHIDERRICNAVCPGKDVDGFHVVNVGRMCLDQSTMLPATPWGVWEIIKRTGIQTLGKNVVVAGRSKNVGMPIAMLLHTDGRHERPGGDATVTISHRYTPKEQLRRHTQIADIIVAAAGSNFNLLIKPSFNVHLKGSYDAISSFPFSLECYKLFVNR